jgi:hypothetical protein
MAESFELTRPAESAGAGFDNDRATANLCKDFEELVTHDPALQNHIAVPVHAVKLEYILGDIDAEGLNGHPGSPSGWLALACRREGEPSIPLAGVKNMAALNWIRRSG